MNTVIFYNSVGTSNVECERLLTDDDFKKIRKLKKRAIEEKLLAKQTKSTGPSIHMPTFNFLEEREKLKKMSLEMGQNFRDDGSGVEEADDEDEIIEESDFEGDEESGEGMEEEIDGEMMLEDDGEGEDEIMEEGEEEDDIEEEGEEEDDEEEDNVHVKGKKLEVNKKKSSMNKGEIREEEDDSEGEEEDSSYDDSESEEKPDPRNAFLATSSIFDPDKVKKRQTLQAIKQGKKDNRDEHLKKKLGHKIKERGRLTNVQKRKNNPYQMFIQKKRLDNRLKDLKSASRQTLKKLQKGQTPRRLGKAFGRKKLKK